MPRRFYYDQAGNAVDMAHSMVGSLRGQYVLDTDMSPPQPASVTQVTGPSGMWRRTTLRCDVKGHYSSEDRQETVKAWKRA